MSWITVERFQHDVIDAFTDRQPVHSVHDLVIEIECNVDNSATIAFRIVDCSTNQRYEALTNYVFPLLNVDCDWGWVKTLDILKNVQHCDGYHANDLETILSDRINAFFQNLKTTDRFRFFGTYFGV